MIYPRGTRTPLLVDVFVYTHTHTRNVVLMCWCVAANAYNCADGVGRGDACCRVCTRFTPARTRTHFFTVMSVSDRQVGD